MSAVVFLFNYDPFPLWSSLRSVFESLVRAQVSLLIIPSLSVVLCCHKLQLTPEPLYLEIDLSDDRADFNQILHHL